MARARTGLLVAAAFAALSDAAVVVLALPGILADLNTTVYGVAAVIALYTAGVAIAVPIAHLVLTRARRPHRPAQLGCTLFGVGAIVCAASQDIGVLLAGRALQSAGAGVVLLLVFEDLAPTERGRRIWAALAVGALALGPALGGLLTQLAGWRAIFVFQAPIGLLAAVAAAGTPALRRVTHVQIADRRGERVLSTVSLALVSGALTAVLFLLVLLLVAGWAFGPLKAAVLVTTIPAGALIGALIHAPPHRKAVVGCALVATGTAAMAFLPNARWFWVLGPAALAGLGMGLSTTGLAGGLLPEITTGHAARLLTLRHAGITLALVALAPVVAHGLDDATEKVKLQGVALALDAPISPAHKLAMAPGLVNTVRAQEPRKALHRAGPKALAAVAPDERPAARTVLRRADGVLVRAVNGAFRTAFLIAAGFALVAAALLAGAFGEWALLGGSVVLLVAVAGFQIWATDRYQPAEVKLQDPCTAKAPPSSGGISGFFQQNALVLVNHAACNLHSTREELVLALADDSEAKRFAHKYGTNPRTAGGVLDALLGG